MGDSGEDAVDMQSHAHLTNTFSAPLLGVSKGSLQRSVGVTTKSQSFEDGRLTIRQLPISGVGREARWFYAFKSCGRLSCKRPL